MKSQYYTKQSNQNFANQNSKINKTNRTNMILIGSFLIIKVLVTGSLTIEFISSWINYYNQIENSHPTSLPWIDNKFECEHRGREWRDKKCWDSEHNMLF